MNIIHVFTKLEDQFSGATTCKITTVSQDTFNKMVAGIGTQFSHFNKTTAIRSDYKVIEVRQAIEDDFTGE